jgi:hypothetical protein
MGTFVPQRKRKQDITGVESFRGATIGKPTLLTTPYIAAMCSSVLCDKGQDV